MRFQYYSPDISKPVPLGVVTLDQFINAVGNPKPQTREIFEQIRIATINKDEKTRADLKKKLHCFTPCVFVNGRRKKENIVNFTGILCLDFDKLPEDYCVEFKNYIFDEYQFVICAWLSASKHGVRAFLNIPICENDNEFKQYYLAVKNHFSNYKGFDGATINCILPLFLSYDPYILYRDNFTQWKKKYIAPNPEPIKQYVLKDKTNSVIKILTNKINVITDNGHPQLRAAASLLGGFVGANHIDYYDAIGLINNLIETNKYLSQKATTYKKTAKTMIDKGIKSPMYLK